MRQQAHETVEAKGQKASNTSMDLSPGHMENDVRRETRADAQACPVCHLTARVAVAIVTIILFTGLLLYLVLFFTWPAAPEVNQTSSSSEQELMVQPQQCEKNYLHDLDLPTATQDPKCSLCPGGWLWWRSHCYFFSVGLQENRQWNESTEFCREHNSSLVVIKDSEEMEFIQGVLRKFPHFPFLWVGLTDSEHEGQWLWCDGTDIQHYMLVTVEWNDDHRDCADLRGGGSLFAADCKSYGPWACKRES